MHHDNHEWLLPYHQDPLSSIVAWYDTKAILNEDLQKRIYDWYLLLAASSKNNFALYFEDSFEFICVLLAGWLAKKTFYLPHNTLQDTCAVLREHVDEYIGDFPAEYSPLIAKTYTSEDTYNEFINTKQVIDDTVNLIIYTSGSTGNPQAITKRLSQLFTEIMVLEKLFSEKISAKAEIVATVSHAHIYGLLFKILWPLLTKRTIHLKSALFFDELWPILSVRHIVLVSSPAHLKRLHDQVAVDERKFPLIDIIFSSADALPFAAAQQVKDLFGKTPIEIFGSTETGGIAWRQADNSAKRYWQAMPNVDFRIAPDDARLEIRSPHLCHTDWLKTMDYAEKIDGQHFLIHGRADHIVKLEGKRVSLTHIEQILLQSELIATARVLLMSKNNLRQHIAAVIVLNKAGEIYLAEQGKRQLSYYLRKCMLNVVEAIAIPRFWRYVEKLPINANGKTTRHELLPLFTAATTRGVDMPYQQSLVVNQGCLLFELVVPKDLIYFVGHFPGAAILPGVVQIDWSIKLARKHFDMPSYFCSMQRIKFQQVILPGMRVQLVLEYDANKQSLSFRYFSDDNQYASGRLLFASTKGNHDA